MKKDYTMDNKQDHVSHYSQSSEYSRRVNEQARMQPNYCKPGEHYGSIKGAKRNEQAGP